MEQVARPRKALFVFVGGVLFWGGGTALLVSLFNWHEAGHFEPIGKILARFGVFMTLGIFFGLSMWKAFFDRSLARNKKARTKAIVQTVLFFGLMLGLLFLLWKMW